jgi:hypothetical protein
MKGSLKLYDVIPTYSHSKICQPNIKYHIKSGAFGERDIEKGSVFSEFEMFLMQQKRRIKLTNYLA